MNKKGAERLFPSENEMHSHFCENDRRETLATRGNEKQTGEAKLFERAGVTEELPDGGELRFSGFRPYVGKSLLHLAKTLRLEMSDALE